MAPEDRDQWGDEGQIGQCVEEINRLQAALRTIAALGDTGSEEHRAAFGIRPKMVSGWPVAKRMRETALDALNEKA